jgi:hypothetical protein
MGHSSAVMTARYTGEISLEKVQEAFSRRKLEKMEVIGSLAALYPQSLACV